MRRQIQPPSTGPCLALPLQPATTHLRAKGKLRAEVAEKFRGLSRGLLPAGGRGTESGGRRQVQGPCPWLPSHTHPLGRTVVTGAGKESVRVFPRPGFCGSRCGSCRDSEGGGQVAAHMPSWEHKCGQFGGRTEVRPHHSRCTHQPGAFPTVLSLDFRPRGGHCTWPGDPGRASGFCVCSCPPHAVTTAAWTRSEGRGDRSLEPPLHPMPRLQATVGQPPPPQDPPKMPISCDKEPGDVDLVSCQQASLGPPPARLPSPQVPSGHQTPGTGLFHLAWPSSTHLGPSPAPASAEGSWE